MTETFYRRLVTALVAFMALAASSVSAQQAKLVVRNFKMLPTDQTAINSATMKKDQNGKTAALIKIYTTLNEEQTYFDNGVMGIVARENKPGQIWIYIPARSQSIQILNTKYPPYTYYFEDEIVAGKTYSMELTVEGKEVTLSASVRQAPIYVDGELAGESPQNVYLSYGEHFVKAEKGEMLFEGNIMVTSDGPSRFELPMEDENLRYSDVTVRVPDNADIYFRGDKVGVGEWKTRLLGGFYTVEIKKENCEDEVVNFEAKAGQPTLVKCPVPVPYRGYLNVTLEPNTGVKVYDGDTIVDQHRLFKQLNVGNYSYTFKKKGYYPITETFTVRRNESTNDTLTLRRIQYVKSDGVYAGLGFNYGTLFGIGAHVGGVFRNFNLEVGYTLGLQNSDFVYWYENPNPGGLYSDYSKYKMDEFEAKVGYQFSFVERLGLTPQLGYLGQRLRGGSHGNGAMCHNLSIGARFVFNPDRRIGVFVDPLYAIPVSVNQLYKDMAKTGGFTKGGFYVSAGVNFNF